MAIHVVLVHPEIHWNTGNAGRTCLATGATLHLESWLPEPVNIGLVAARVESVNINFQQQQMPNGMWGPKRFEITLKGRAFFKRLDHHQVTTWVFQ